MKTTQLIVTLILFAKSSYSQSNKNDSLAIVKNYYLMDEYFSKNQMEKIAEIYADSAQVIGNYFQLKGKKAIENYWLQLKDKGIRWDHTINTLTIDKNYAFQRGISELEYKNGIENKLSKVRYTVVWVKNEHNEWKILIDHYTLY